MIITINTHSCAVCIKSFSSSKKRVHLTPQNYPVHAPAALYTLMNDVLTRTPLEPAGPGGPRGPAGPWAPALPLPPCAPLNPLSPFAPAGPVNDHNMYSA